MRLQTGTCRPGRVQFLTAVLEPRLFERVTCRRKFLTLLPLALAAGCTHAASRTTGPTWPLVTLSGDAIQWRPPSGTEVVVFEFLGVECPISNRALPELSRLASSLAPRVIFVPVYPNADESADAIRHHREVFRVAPEAYRDPGQRLADALKAQVTPEVVALTVDGRPIYRGRVNDQFSALGQGRPAPTRHDLADALRSYLGNLSPMDVVTSAAGCRIARIP